MAKCVYMHTINGCPGEFIDGRVMFAHLRIKTVPTLRQIRREHEESRLWSEQWTRDTSIKSEDFKLGYVTIAVPSQ